MDIIFTLCTIVLLVGLILEERHKINTRKKSERAIEINKYRIDEHKVYEELLKDERWQDKRKEILTKHNYTCDWCGTHENLQVHHKYYLRYPNNIKVYPWQYPDDCFMCLCDNCHKKYHQKYKVKTYYRRY